MIPFSLPIPAFGANCVDADKEVVTELPNRSFLARPFSLRCVFCIYVHGAAPFQSCCGNSGGDPPEYVAIRLAQALVVLMSLWHGRQCYLDASLVVMCGSGWM